jgi:hypothetical protein
MLEQSLQAIDVNVTVPYWDYTEDEFTHDDWTKATMFNDDMFGAASPAHDSHAVGAGRWAFTPIKYVANNASGGDYSRIHNPYGLLRSPWNTNPTPFLLRYRRTLGKQDAGYRLPK